MSVLGIIAEYDPFHNGHLYHLSESLSQTGADASVCVMSGDFTQRGLPAMFEKRLRAQAAVKCGVDLVIELPFVYAANNAAYFAYGAVRILEGLGVVDYLSFGSESGDVAALSKVATLFAEDSDELNAMVREAMGSGVSYPAARARAAASLLGPEAAALMKDPNNILAIEYLKEMRLLGCDIEPVTVRRHAAGLDEADARARIAGATAIREMFRSQHPGAGDEADGQQRTNAGHEADEQQHPGAGDGAGSPWAYIPAAATPFISGDVEGWGGSLVFDDALFPYLVHTVIAAEQGALSRIFSATEGLENRLISAVHRAHNIHEAVRYTKTRRYTETRVRRLILHTIMGLTKELMSEALEEPPYARILAFSETGAKLIRRVKKSGNIPVISNANREKTLLSSSPVTFGFDVRTAEIYRLLQTGNIAGFNECTAR